MATTVPVFYFYTISVLQIFLFGETLGRRNCIRTACLETRMLHQRGEAEIRVWGIVWAMLNLLIFNYIINIIFTIYMQENGGLS